MGLAASRYYPIYSWTDRRNERRICIQMRARTSCVCPCNRPGTGPPFMLHTSFPGSRHHRPRTDLLILVFFFPLHKYVSFFHFLCFFFFFLRTPRDGDESGKRLLRAYVHRRIQFVHTTIMFITYERIKNAVTCLLVTYQSESNGHSYKRRVEINRTGGFFHNDYASDDYYVHNNTYLYG